MPWKQKQEDKITKRDQALSPTSFKCHSWQCIAVQLRNQIPGFGGPETLEENKGTSTGHYLCLETLHQDGHQQVKENIIPKGHECDEVESSPGGGRCHAIVEDLVPVFLGQNLQSKNGDTGGSCAVLPKPG